MFNTIVLKKGEGNLTKSEYKNFNRGDMIFNINSEPEEVKRWNFTNKDEARRELARYSCEYIEYADCWSIKEYALEYCECDENGEFIQGSDYDLAD